MAARWPKRWTSCSRQTVYKASPPTAWPPPSTVSSCRATHAPPTCCTTATPCCAFPPSPEAEDMTTASPSPHDTWRIGDIELRSRFLLGTAGYPSPGVLRQAIEASGSQVLTLGLKRTLAVPGAG